MSKAAGGAKHKRRTWLRGNKKPWKKVLEQACRCAHATPSLDFPGYCGRCIKRLA